MSVVLSSRHISVSFLNLCWTNWYFCLLQYVHYIKNQLAWFLIILIIDVCYAISTMIWNCCSYRENFSVIRLNWKDFCRCYLPTFHMCTIFQFYFQLISCQINHRRIYIILLPSPPLYFPACSYSYFDPISLYYPFL